MTTLYLIRHGEYENSDYVFPDASGVPAFRKGESASANRPVFSDKP